MAICLLFYQFLPVSYNDHTWNNKYKSDRTRIRHYFYHIFEKILQISSLVFELKLYCHLPWFKSQNYLKVTSFLSYQAAVCVQQWRIDCPPYSLGQAPRCSHGGHVWSAGGCRNRRGDVTPPRPCLLPRLPFARSCEQRNYLLVLIQEEYSGLRRSNM